MLITINPIEQLAPAPAKALALLEGLGTTAAEVAAALAKAGIVGTRCHGGDCPVYNFLVKNGVRVFKVTADAATSFLEGWRIPLPEPVQDFIDVYDGGAFSFLVRPDAEDSAE
jgi:hypothetical protein